MAAATRVIRLAALVVLLGGCASQTPLTQEERSTIERALTGRERYLRLSFYVTPFFGDAGKRLLTSVPPEEVRLLEYPDGTPVNPGPAEKILPAGTRVRISRVEFPTAWAMAERVLYTPRAQPWVYLEAAGEKGPTPLIVVLRPKIKDHNEFMAELERYVVEHDPGLLISGFPEAMRQAIQEKRALIDMPAEALEMAWGYPEVRKVSFEGSVRREDWIYPGGARVAHLANGRVSSLEGGRR